MAKPWRLLGNLTVPSASLPSRGPRSASCWLSQHHAGRSRCWQQCLTAPPELLPRRLSASRGSWGGQGPDGAQPSGSPTASGLCGLPPLPICCCPVIALPQVGIGGCVKVEKGGSSKPVGVCNILTCTYVHRVPAGGLAKQTGSAQSCPTLRPHGLYSVQGILQARILEWVAISFSRGSSQPRD